MSRLTCRDVTDCISSANNLSVSSKHTEEKLVNQKIIPTHRIPIQLDWAAKCNHNLVFVSLKLSQKINRIILAKGPQLDSARVINSTKGEQTRCLARFLKTTAEEASSQKQLVPLASEVIFSVKELSRQALVKYVSRVIFSGQISL